MRSGLGRWVTEVGVLYPTADDIDCRLKTTGTEISIATSDGRLQ